jgi:peptidoglycan DL-endopeptidase CwlO
VPAPQSCTVHAYLTVVRSSSFFTLFVAAAAAFVTAVACLPVLASGALSTDDDQLSGLMGGAVCATSGPITGLTAEQAQTARTIAAVASARGGNHAALIAVMTGLAESNLRSLGNPNDPTAGSLYTEDSGTDHDSLGVFQQRPSWGTATQRLDAIASTNLFLDRLLATAESNA